MSAVTINSHCSKLEKNEQDIIIEKLKKISEGKILYFDTEDLDDYLDYYDLYDYNFKDRDSDNFHTDIGIHGNFKVLNFYKNLVELNIHNDAPPLEPGDSKDIK